eukprot:364280-Chlamydomonas_euryale.AAC.17
MERCGALRGAVGRCGALWMPWQRYWALRGAVGAMAALWGAEGRCGVQWRAVGATACLAPCALLAKHRRATPSLLNLPLITSPLPPFAPALEAL